jgi:hypothetical protein
MARALLGKIQIHGVDDERIGKNDEITTDRAIDVELDLSQPTANIDIDPVKWGGECRVEIQVKVRLLVGEQILVEGNVKLFEGGSEDTNDLEDEQPFEFFVPKRTKNLPPTEHEVKVASTGSGGGDYAEIKFLLTNRFAEDE